MVPIPVPAAGVVPRWITGKWMAGEANQWDKESIDAQDVGHVVAVQRLAGRLQSSVLRMDELIED